MKQRINYLGLTIILFFSMRYAGAAGNMVPEGGTNGINELKQAMAFQTGLKAKAGSVDSKRDVHVSPDGNLFINAGNQKRRYSEPLFLKKQSSQRFSYTDFLNQKSVVSHFKPAAFMSDMRVLKALPSGKGKSGRENGISYILHLGANEGATSSDGVSKDLRIIPNAGLEFNFNSLGIGFDLGTYNSAPDFNFDNYYKQFSSFGFAKLEKTRDHWKSTYFSFGPQYSFNLGSPGSGKATASAVPGNAAGVKSLMLTVSLKGGITRNQAPEIIIRDTLTPFKTIASYRAADSVKTNGYNIKPSVVLTYWFTKNIGASVNAQYLVAGGQQEFSTGYRDLSKVEFGLGGKEVWSQITRAPIVTSTTRGPGNMFSFGAGISVKFGSGKKQTSLNQENDPAKTESGKEVTSPAKPVEITPEDNKTQEAVSAPGIPEKDAESEQKKEYIRPTALTPVDGSSLSEEESKTPVTLTWTAVMPPPPAGDVIYHVKVVEMDQKQDKKSALNSNKAVFEKDIPLVTSSVFNVPQLEKGETKKYAWTVQATSRAGKPYGENNGTSEPSAFVVGQNDIDIAIDSLDVECCKDGKQKIKITVKNNLPNTNTTLRKVWIMAVNGNFGTPYPTDISTMVSPPLPFNFLPSSTSGSQGRVNFTANIDCIKNISSIVLKAEGDRNTNMGLVTDNDLESDTLQCICLECDKIKIEIPDKAQISNSANAFTINTPVIVSPKKVVKITADRVYFSFVPESEDCVPCNKDSKTYGNFNSSTLTAPGFPSAGSIQYGHEITWNSNSGSGSLLNGQFSFVVSMPPVVKCCSAAVRVCIRYSFQFDDCTVCDKVVCYSFSKQGCNK